MKTTVNLHNKKEVERNQQSLCDKHDNYYLCLKNLST